MSNVKAGGDASVSPIMLRDDVEGTLKSGALPPENARMWRYFTAEQREQVKALFG